MTKAERREDDMRRASGLVVTLGLATKSKGWHDLVTNAIALQFAAVREETLEAAARIGDEAQRCGESTGGWFASEVRALKDQ